ncbi:MAG: 23S rRNA (pseudouridine(1915)-N(3))-methyltransferase RlmH [Bacteroidales bacterium]|nr:23S rRNA (pseudouridine(1915)-N(3))-methyltransferase RlmH [Bacteroidales bacterium]MBN2699139.1 23S rRNA (pseudouridine(1915)-N(3))-methyltransferase RlmH [Bacteroidales bacterium]
MRITLLEIGKTRDDFINEGIEVFRKRIARYVNFNIVTIPGIKNTRNMIMKEVQHQEGIKILKFFKNGDYNILLDERGKEYDSISLAEHLNELYGKANHIQFIVGGPYGFSEEVYQKANELMALSRLTFSHQMVRLIFMEQIYRAFTIIKGEPYHHA